MNFYNVFCNKLGMFPHFGTLTGVTGNTRRFVGWTQEAGKWVPRTEPESIQACPEYARALRQGDLIPADEETATAVGLTFQK